MPSRLSKDPERSTGPWRRARDLDQCYLYWLPVGCFPVSAAERSWLMTFLDRWAQSMQRDLQLRIEQFLCTRAIHPALTQAFATSSREFKPVPGLNWHPGSKPAKKLTEEELKTLQDGRKKFDFGEYVNDQSYWFLNKSERKQREQFFGHGGMTILYMKPDPRTQPPALPISESNLRGSPVFGAIFSKFDLTQTIAEAYALQDSFLPKSREILAAANASQTEPDGIQFAVPALGSQDFFSRPQTCMPWFQLFDVYVTESLDDQGILLASKKDIEEHLAAIVQQMENEGMVYPEGSRK